MTKNITKLVLRAQRMDKSAMEELTAAFAPLLKRYAYCWRAEDAYACLQLDFIEIVLRVPYQKLEKAGDAAFVNYFQRALYHSYIAHSRADAKHKEVLWEELSSAQKARCEAKAGTPFTYDSLLAADMHQLLTRKEYQVLVLYALYGYSVAEIAQKQGISRQAVNSAKKRALEKLRKAWGEAGPG